MHFKHYIGADDDARKILKYCVHNRSHFSHICRVLAVLWNPAQTAYCGALWESSVQLKCFLKVLSELLIITIADHPDNDGVGDES